MTETATPTSASTKARPRKLTPVAVILAAIAGLALLIGMSLGGSSYSPPEEGIPDPGPVVGWGLPIAKLLVVISGTLTIGFLTSAAFLLPAADKRTVTHVGRSDIKIAGWSAVSWAVVAVMAIVFGNAAVVGQPLLASLEPDLFFTFAFEPTIHKAYAFSAVLALVVAVGCLFTVRTGATFVLLAIAGIALPIPSIASHSSSVGDHSLALTAGAITSSSSSVASRYK